MEFDKNFFKGKQVGEIHNRALKMQNPRAALIVAALFWGASPVATRYLSEGRGTALLLLYRFIPSLVMLASWHLITHRLPSISNWRLSRALVVSLVGGLGYNGFVTAALVVSPATLVGIALTTEPMWILLLEVLFGARSFSAHLLIGFSLAVIGTIVATISSIQTGGNVFLGVVLATLGTLSWGIYTVAGSKWRATSVDKTTLMTIVSVPFVLPPLFLAGHSSGLIPNTASGILAIVALSLGSTVIAMISWNYGTARLGAKLSAPFLYLQPVSTIGLSAILLAERPTSLQLVGLGLIIFGLLISQRNS